MAITSSIGLKGINESVRSLGIAVTRVKKSSFLSSKILMNRTKVKRSSLFEGRRLFQRKKESIRIKDRENIIEASKLVAPIQRGTAAIARSTQGFLGRILEFAGTLLTGWLLYNLPTLIAMAKELMGRITRIVQLLKGFVSNLGNTMRGFGNVLGAVFQNVMSFDFLDTSKRVDKAMKGLTGTFDDMGAQIDEGLRLLTTSLGEGLVTGETAPEFGTRFPAQPEAGAPSVSGTKYPQLSSIIVKGEGGLNSVNRGNAGDTPGGAKSVLGRNLTDMTVGEVMQAQREGRVSAVGKYQFIPGTLAGAVKHTKVPLNAKFDKTTQDRLFDYLIEVKRPIVGEYLKGKSNNKREAIQELAREFASVGLEYPEAGRRRGQSRYAGLAGNRASISPETIGNALDAQRQAGPSQVNVASSSSTTSPAQITPTTLAGAIPSQSLLPKLPPTDTLRGGVQRYGASRDKGARKHAGTDFDIRGNEKFYSRIGGVVTKVEYQRGGYGHYIDIYNAQLGVYERIAEGAKVLVKKGQTVQPGQPVVQGEGPTGVIHYEIRKNPGYGFQGTVDPLQFLANIKPISTPTQIAAQPQQRRQQLPAQIAAQSQQRRQQLPGQITPERRGPQILLIDDIQPQQPTMPMGGGGGGIIPIVINPLNSYIKNKLLLDLAYT